MESSSLQPVAKSLLTRLTTADSQTAENSAGPMFHVASIGGTFYFAYEQLRNAAEYREHHLLLRSAIERYFRRYVRLDRFEQVGADMVTELTQAGYLKNDSVLVSKVALIDDIMGRYSKLLGRMERIGNTGRKTATTWVFQIAAAEVEELILPNRRLPIMMAFAYEHFLAAVDRKEFGDVPTDDYSVALYAASQRAIFKSDLASTRYYCLAAGLSKLSEETLAHFVRVNQLIDQYYQAPLTNRIFRLINRYGAPMRVLREVVIDHLPDPAALNDRPAMLAKIKRVCGQQYTILDKSLGRRITKTILFILITKVLLGVSIEVPYDLFAKHAIDWLPLCLNVLFPVGYMMLLSYRIAPPERHNTELIAAFSSRILYDQESSGPVTYRVKKRVTSSSMRNAFTSVYGVGFSISFGLLIWALYKLGFNVVNGLIFFLFLSAVSFLGFRLRQSARELAMLDEKQSLIQTLADFLSTPFVRVGYWLSDRYSKLNLVTRLLDVAVELPLKTSLRFVRQWVGFLRDKQDEL